MTYVTIVVELEDGQRLDLRDLDLQAAVALLEQAGLGTSLVLRLEASLHALMDAAPRSPR